MAWHKLNLVAQQNFPSKKVSGERLREPRREAEQAAKRRGEAAGGAKRHGEVARSATASNVARWREAPRLAMWLARWRREAPRLAMQGCEAKRCGWQCGEAPRAEAVDPCGEAA